MSEPFAGRIRHVDHYPYPPLSVTLDEIDAQRALGWPDFHPESYCHRCGHENASWYVDGPTWVTVMRGGSQGADERWQGIVCMPCFAELAERIWPDVSWHIGRDEYGIATLTRAAAAT